VTLPVRQLGDVCEIIMGQAPDGASYNDKAEGVPLIAGAGDFGPDWPAPKKFTSLPTKTSLPNDIVMSIRATIGTKVLSDGIYCLGRGVAGLRAKGQLDTRYLWHWISEVEATLSAKGRGATFPQVNRNDIAELPILLPSMAEQRQIAAILDKADALRRKRKRAIELLDSLTQSIFLEMFGEGDEQLLPWSEPVHLSDLADIGSGITKGRKLSGSATREVPYLAVVNVQDRRLDLSTIKYIEATDTEIERYRLQPNDLLLTEGGDPDKLGRGTLWAGELNEAIHQNHIFRVRITSSRILPLFLNWLVGTSYGKKYFLSAAKQTTGIASINKTQLSAFPTILPPIELQQKFVGAAEGIAREMKQFISAETQANILFSSLQSRAFSGQL